MTDIHCHILPEVDDGSKDWNMTIEMCNKAHADGIKHVVATPHANNTYRYNRERASDLLAQLREKYASLKFTLGCDFHLSYENIQDAIQNPERYSIGNTNYLLVELSDYQTPDQMTSSLFRLHSAGFATIVTHPERNQIVDQYPDLCQQFVDMGSVIQITAGALCGNWGRKPKKTCEALLKKGLVSIIATDAHEATRRIPVLSVARKVAAKTIGETAADLLVYNNPMAVVSNHHLA